MYQNRFRSQTWTAIACAAAVTAAMLQASSASADPLKCMRTISKSTAKYEVAVQKALGKCQDALAKGKVPSCPDSKASGKIAGALTKLQDKIDTGCTGETVASAGFAGLVKICNGGINDGQQCSITSDCLGECAGGAEPGHACLSNSSCPANCVGGTHNGESCAAGGASVCTGGGGACTDLGTCTGPAPGTCDPEDRCQASIDFGAPFANCDAPLTNLADIEACLVCNADANAQVATDWAWEGRRPPFSNPSQYGLPDAGDDGKTALGCQRALGKAASKYFQAVRKATQKCTDALLKGTVPSCPDSKLTDKLTGALQKMTDKINTKCSGTAYAETFFGKLDPTNVLANGPTLDPLLVPNTSDNFAATTAAVLGKVASCSDSGAVPSTLPTCVTLCGNGRIDVGEECDDGNVVNGDFCSSDCQRTPCTVTGTVTATVTATGDASVLPLGALTSYVTYDQSKVSIPGNGDSGGLRTTSNSFVTAVNDLDYAVRVVQVDPADIGLPYTIDFDVCSGAAVTNADFNCMVEEAGKASPATAAFGVTCSVSVP